MDVLHHSRERDGDSLFGTDNAGCCLRGQYNEARIYAENNWAIRVIGQSRSRTIIRLKDNAPGFGAGTDKALLAFYRIVHSTV